MRGSGKELLFSVTPNDCEMQTFRSGGAGGQNQNKRDTGVRYIHKPSGAVGEARDERSQWQNRQLAWKRMAEHPKFKIWIAQEIWLRSGLPSPEKQVEKDLRPGNLKMEIRVGGKWTEVNPEELTGD